MSMEHIDELKKQNEALVVKVDEQNRSISQILGLLNRLLVQQQQCVSGNTTDASSVTRSSRGGSQNSNGLRFPAMPKSRTGEYINHIWGQDKIWRETTNEQFEDDLDDEEAFVSICEDFTELNRIRS